MLHGQGMPDANQLHSAVFSINVMNAVAGNTLLECYRSLLVQDSSRHAALSHTNCHFWMTDLYRQLHTSASRQPVLASGNRSTIQAQMHQCFAVLVQLRSEWT